MAVIRRHAIVALAVAALLGSLAARATPFADFNFGVAANENSRCDKAVPYMTSALTQPGLLADLRPLALLVRGGCYEGDKNYDSALADYKAALALRPDSFDAYFARGGLHLRRGEFDAAAADYGQTIRIRPDLPRGYHALAFTHMRAKMYDEAIADLTRASKLDVAVETSYIFRSAVHITKGEFDAAMDDADKLVSIDNKWPRGFVERGRIYSHQGRFSRAEDAFNDALRLQNDNAAALVGKGVAQWSQDDFKNAAATLGAVAPRVPTEGYVTLWLDIARVDAGKPDADLAKRAEAIDLKKWPGPLVSLFLGQTTPETVSAEAVATGPDHADEVCEANFYTAEWQIQHTAKDAALTLLNQAVQDCPKTNLEWDAAGVLLKRLGKR